MHVFILGPPGGGKTSVSTVLKERYGMCYISPGDAVLHAVEHSGAAYSEQLRQLLGDGKPIPDGILSGVVAEATRRPDCNNGFLIDNFPQTAAQARLLSASGVHPDAILVLHAPDQWFVDRYAARWLHPASGRMYHTLYSPPHVRGRDDVTQQPLSQRHEDTEEAVRQRLRRFHDSLKELRGFYEGERLWYSVDGAAPVVKVHLAACKVLDPLVAARKRRWWSGIFFWRSNDSK